MVLQAQLKGKLTRKEEDMEDLLTSNVFGSIKYASPNEGLEQILASSEDTRGYKLSQSFQEILDAKYDFWPKLRKKGCNSCEPDLLIRLQLANGQQFILIVEAKYRSGKSSFADASKSPTDQLAREWQYLYSLADSEKRTPMLLFVTADIGLPVESIIESQDELRRKGFPEMTIYWISWRRIYSIFSGSKDESILGDMVKVLRRMGMTFFEGKFSVKKVQNPWEFRSGTSLNWSYYAIQLKWAFCLTKAFKWSFRNKVTQWRFKN